MSATASNVNNKNATGSLFDDGEIRRRRWILNSIPHMSKSQARDLWSNILTDVEKESSIIVYKLLQYNDVHNIFGTHPWRNRQDVRPSHDTALDDLPTKFRNNIRAFIAFTKQDNFISVHGMSSYDVPAQFRDDFDAIKAICSVNCANLYRASDRLKDNEDLVFAACFLNKDGWDEMEALVHASDRLRNSQQFIGKCFLEISVRCCQKKDYTHHFDWIRQGKNGFRKDFLSGVMGSFSIQDISKLLRILPPRAAADAAEYYPDAFFDNEEAVFDLMKRLDRPAVEKLYRSKSKHLQLFESIRAMIDPSTLQDVDDDEKVRIDDGKMKEDYIIDQISNNNITSFNDIPEMLRLNQRVLSKSVECCWFDAGLESILSFTAAVKDTKVLWYERSKHWENCKLYSILPENLKKDEEVAIALLESGCDEINEMTNTVPSLCKSKRALIAMLHVNDIADRGNDEIDRFIEDSPFCGDKEMMILACNMNDRNLEVVDKTLFEDRDFMEKVKHPDAITKSSEEFQLSNLDLVALAISRLREYNIESHWWCEDISFKIWSNRSVVMKWLTREEGGLHYDDRHILEFLYHLIEDEDEEITPLFSDKEVVSLSVRRRPLELQYAHKELKNDKMFILQCVRNSGVKEPDRILEYVPEMIRYDYDIMAAAISKSDGNVIDCWNILKSDADAEFLTTLLHQTKTKLELHDVFIKVFLMGASRDDQHTFHPSLRSPLPMLNQGAETSIKLKKKIAEYAGVPIGQSYIEMKGAIAALQRFGF